MGNTEKIYHKKLPSLPPVQWKIRASYDDNPGQVFEWKTQLLVREKSQNWGEKRKFWQSLFLKMNCLHNVQSRNQEGFTEPFQNSSIIFFLNWNFGDYLREKFPPTPQRNFIKNITKVEKLWNKKFWGSLSIKKLKKFSTRIKIWFCEFDWKFWEPLHELFKETPFIIPSTTKISEKKFHHCKKLNNFFLSHQWEKSQVHHELAGFRLI